MIRDWIKYKPHRYWYITAPGYWGLGFARSPSELALQVGRIVFYKTKKR